MDLLIANQQRDLPLSLQSVEGVVHSILKRERCKAAFLSLSFVSRQKISSLHKTFFDDPAITDCISFPLDDHYLGEIFVCPWAALRYVKRSGGEVYEEVTLYVLHGLLHLLGYDDLEAKERRKMRAAEEEHMEWLRKRGEKIRSEK